MATPIPHNHAQFTLSEIAEATSGVVVGVDHPIVGVVADSREVERGNLYVALAGEQHDGHRFVAQALLAGATAALVHDRAALPVGASGVVVNDTLRALGDLAAAHRRRWGGRVIAITGSAGKTTTKELTFAALRAAGAKVARSEGNLNNLIGTPMSVFCLDAQVDMAVLEIGTSARGEIARLTQITGPEIGVVTGVAAAHTAGLGSLLQVAQEKASLLWALPEHGTAIYRADDSTLVTQIGGVRAGTRIGFGSSRDAQVTLIKQVLSATPGMLCEFALAGRMLRCELNLFGSGPALDAAAALAVVLAALGEDSLDKAALGLSQVMPPPGRLSPVVGPSGSLVLDDSYNANPASMRASIDTAIGLARVRGGRAVLVLGDMLELGERSAAEHQVVGKLSARAPVSILIACGAEMTKAAEAAREQARCSQQDLSISHLADAAGAGDLLAPLLREGDVVLVKGSRSMRLERVVDSLRSHAAGGA